MPNPIKLTIKSEFFSLALIVISIIASFYFYAHFPEKVITHWNFAGAPDGYSGRAFAAFFFPALFIGMYFLFIFLPALDPKKERYAEFAKVYNIFRNLILAAMFAIYFIASFSNLGVNLNISLWIPAAVGLLFIVLGNYFGKIKRNWFVGIRTPWTMSSETVWNKTHRFGGRIFVLCGVIMILTGFSPAGWRLPLFIVNLIIILFSTIVYSYLVYLNEKKK